MDVSVTKSAVSATFKDGLPDTTELDEAQMKNLLTALGVEASDNRLDAMIAAAGTGNGTVAVEGFIDWLFSESSSGAEGAAAVASTSASTSGAKGTDAIASTSADKSGAKGAAAVASTYVGSDGSQPTFSIVHASILAQLQDVFKTSPFAEPGNSVFVHPAHAFVETCRKCLDAGKFEQAQEAIRRVRNVIDIDNKQIMEAFRRFDVDKSGFLEEAECRHLNAYLGWSSEQWHMLDLNKDSKVSSEEFQAFIGRLGGVRQLFEQRRLRISTSRKDVCDYIGVAEGARVRAHYYVQGRKSASWKEAQVIKVGVQRHFGAAAGGMGPGTLGVLLQFGFGAQGSTKMWTARQVVPPTWILSGVEDAAVVSAMRESGILDEQQSFWSLLLPETEMQAIARLESCQRNALSIVRAQATKLHGEALPALKERFEKLGYNRQTLSLVFEWVQDLAPVCVHLHLDKMGHFMEQDEFYRNQFETKTSCGALDPENDTRKGWERELFGGAYENAKPFERCKYGALSVMNDYRGIKSAYQYGDSYLVLKDVRLRCTFASTDSGGLSGSRLAVLDKYAHVLKEYSDKELEGVIAVAEAAKDAGASETSVRPDLLRGSTEDPIMDWLTFGYPGLAESSGCMYFEVSVLKGSYCPQVGVVSTEFKHLPGMTSSEGVGDDEHSWSVDGMNAIRWHKGMPLVWNQTWKSSDEPALAEDVTVGVAVNFNNKTLTFSTNGSWDETPTFKDLPEGACLFPAISFKGKAAFCFGPSFKHNPPSADSSGSEYGVWPKAPKGSHRIDVPLIGNSEILSIYKEVQIHGEVSLKRNVQRLVANRKYKDGAKMSRSWGLAITNAGVCSGKYKRAGGHDDTPVYKNKTGCMAYYDSDSSQWRITDKEDDFSSTFAYSNAVGSVSYPPSAGWELLDEVRGMLKPDFWRAGLLAKGASAETIETLAAKLLHKDANGEDQIWRSKAGVSFDDEWGKLENPPSDASEAWKAGVTSTQNELLNEYGITGAQMIETEHPYQPVSANWTKEVTIEGAAALVIHFDPRCHTFDSYASVTVYSGGMNRNAAGPGARLELEACCGQKIWGTAVERTLKDGLWKVLLDREKSERAIEHIAIYKSAAPTDLSTDCFAYCQEDVKRVQVDYKKKDGPSFDAQGFGFLIGDELLSFKLDRTTPMTPIIVEKLSSTPGPAQEAGVKEGWYVDLVKTFGGPSRKKLARILDGIGGKKFEMEKPDSTKMLEAAMSNLDQFLVLLNQNVRALDEATFWFINSSSASKPTLMPDAHVAYGAEVKPSSEIKDLSLHEGNVIVAGFNEGGAAKAAGVRSGWALDMPKTLALNENLATSLKEISEEDVLSKAKAALEQPGTCLAFRSLNPTKKEVLKAYGSPVESKKFKSCEVVGDHCEFVWNTDGDGASVPDRRWGFWALVSAKPEGQEEAKEPVEFAVEVELSESTSLGIEMKAATAKAAAAAAEGEERFDEEEEEEAEEEDACVEPEDVLMITGLSEGLIEDWNKASSEYKVKVHDHIVQVNDVKDPSGMMSELKKLQKHKLTVKNPEGKAAIPCPVDDIDVFSKKLRLLTGKAEGNQEIPKVICDSWDRQRLLDLCAKHGWDFEWMTEDGERRRRANETLTSWTLQESMVALLQEDAAEPDGTVTLNS
eukprot:TRINITY_DN8818_c0_g1_i1.p1 TRINITY_DN8818_c0_g1~~TRINITY_DN8818_c0_g1_i1.p1  ORF type:complete len:1644 (+),score=312.68 TRINITY_DN8818_c0_g1_i1:85-5016(+)